MCIGAKVMSRAKGAKTISVRDRDKMKSIIIPRLKFRDSAEDLLESLEDKGFEVSLGTVYELKKEIRESLGDRYKEIGMYELAEEHDYAIGMMKYLMKSLQKDLFNCDNNGEKVRVSAEIRAIQKDLIDLYGSSDIVENVFKYFNDDKEEVKETKTKEVKEKMVEKKHINKPKRKLLTEI